MSRFALRAARSPELYLLVLLAATLVWFSANNPFFGTSANFTGLAAGAAVLGVAAMGVTVALAAGAIDFSIAGTIALSGVVAAWLDTRVGGVVAILGALAVAVLVGIVNGTVVTRFGINPFIATLATAGTLRGLAFLVAGSSAGIVIEDGPIVTIGQHEIVGIPVPIVMFAVIAVLGWALLAHTPAGRALLAVGGNPEAARLSGIGVAGAQRWAYLASAGAAGVAGILLAGRTGSGLPQAAAGQELLVYSAVILGGTSLWGGRATVIGSVLGILFVETLRNGLVLERVSPYWQTILQGVFLVAAVWLVRQQQLGRDPVWLAQRIARRRRSPQVEAP
ncbi:MAG: ABC transporter permease [Solirubrobacteraceae bacterium]|mgnify:FL=1|nr:ABC transporter permease [Solirubrobacteraceae bacterium]